VWTHVSQYAGQNGVVDLSKLGITTTTDDQKRVARSEAVKLMFMHFLPTLTNHDDQKVMQDFMETLLPPLSNAFESMMTTAREKAEEKYRKQAAPRGTPPDKYLTDEMKAWLYAHMDDFKRLGCTAIYTSRTSDVYDYRPGFNFHVPNIKKLTEEELSEWWELTRFENLPDGVEGAGAGNRDESHAFWGYDLWRKLD